MLWSLPLLVAAVAFGAIVLLGQAADDRRSADASGDPGGTLSSWRVKESMADGLRCGVCHYSPGPVWWTEWSAAERGGWDLTVKPREPDVPLVAVAAGLEEPSLLHLERIQGQLDAEGRWRLPFDVPEGASSLVVQYHTDRTETVTPLALGLAVVQRSEGENDVPSRVWAVSPDGARHEVIGPEVDLHLALLGPDVVRPGPWALEVQIDDADPSRYTALASIEALRGPVVASTMGAPATFHFEGMAPPETLALHVRPYHDHAPYEDREWDREDTQPYSIMATTLPGPAPPPAWAVADPLTAWAESTEVIVLDREVQFFEVYEDRPGHKDDGGFFSSKPKYYVPAGPVPAGTRSVSIEATWLPPTDEPLLDIRVKPHGTLRYADAPVILREPGRAIFDWPTEPWMWDVAEHDGGAHEAHGSWDFAPYFQDSGQDIERHAIDLRLVATAMGG